MRNKTNLSILGIVCLTLVLRADSCLVEQRQVSLILPAQVPAHWETVGHTQSTDEDTDFVSAAGPLRDALDDDPLPGDITHVYLSGVTYRVLTNTGHSTRRQGTVSIDFGKVELGVLTFDIPNNDAGLEGKSGDGDPSNGQVDMVAAGVDEMNTRLNAWLDAYRANPGDDSYDSLLDFTWRATWDSSLDGDPPSASDPDNFTWETNLIILIEKNAEVDVGPTTGGN
jgi:hypothetical protein